MYPIKTPTKYNPENLATTANTYTTVYLGNYVSGNFDEDVGSHCGVDIIPMVPNDTVVAVLPGVVEISKTGSADGEHIVIRHENVPSFDDPNKTTTLYSCYLHLSCRMVQAGDVVAEGAIIGQTGNTGQSTWEHLHFQIDTKDAPFHPYWPFTFADAKDLGLGFFEAVNRGIGIDKARKYTVNPLVYLDWVKLPPAQNQSHTETIRVATHTDVAQKSESPVVFNDVSPQSVYAKAIEYVAKNHIANGSNGSFRPEAWVTRAEIVKMALNAAGCKLSTDPVPHFSDISIENSFLPYINTAREMAAISGYADGTFRPDIGVTRAEGLKIVLSILGIHPAKDALGAFEDVSPTDWVAPYASWAKQHEVFLDVNRAILQPNTHMKRAEVANLIYRAKSLA